MRPMLALFRLTVRQTLVQRQIWFGVLLLVSPAAITILIRYFGSPPSAEAQWERYHGPAQVLLIDIGIPLLCMLNGIALIASETESRTIIYLLTRRMRRATVLLVRFVAVALVLAVLSELSMIAHHLCATVGVPPPATGSLAWRPNDALVGYLVVIPVAVVTFLAVFTAVGLILTRALSISIIYLIFFEMGLGNAPITGRVYTITHQLRLLSVDLMPNVKRFFQLPPAVREAVFPAGATGLFALTAVVVISLLIAGILISVRELLPAKTPAPV